MGRQLQQAAKASNDHTVRRPAIRASCVRRWEAGKFGLTERYRLHYCTALGIQPSQFGPSQLQTQQPELASTSVGTTCGNVVAASPLAAPEGRSGTDVPDSPGELGGDRGARNGHTVPERPEQTVPVADSPDLLMAMIAEQLLDIGERADT